MNWSTCTHNWILAIIQPLCYTCEFRKASRLNGSNNRIMVRSHQKHLSRPLAPRPPYRWRSVGSSGCDECPNAAIRNPKVICANIHLWIGWLRSGGTVVGQFLFTQWYIIEAVDRGFIVLQLTPDFCGKWAEQWPLGASGCHTSR